MTGMIEAVDAAKPGLRLLKRAARLIARGEVLVCPTDTGYALSANAIDSRAIARVFNLKGRSFSNPIHVAVSSIEEAGKYAQLNDAARYLAGKFLPGALTLILPKKDIIPDLLVGGLDTIGIRIPNNKVILRLAELTGRPLTATSANISGQPTPYAVEEIGEVVEKVALVLDQGPLRVRELSTIVDMTVEPPQLIRQGRVSWLDIVQVLKLRKSADSK